MRYLKNKFASECSICKQMVPTGEGHLMKRGKKWITRHWMCIKIQRAEVQEAVQFNNDHELSFFVASGEKPKELEESEKVNYEVAIDAPY